MKKKQTVSFPEGRKLTAFFVSKHGRGWLYIENKLASSKKKVSLPLIIYAYFK